MEYYSAIKNESMPFIATWMQAETIVLSKSERKRPIPYDIPYMWHLSPDTNEPVNKTDSRTEKGLVCRGDGVGKGRGRAGAGGWGYRCKLPRIEWIATRSHSIAQIIFNILR